MRDEGVGFIYTRSVHARTMSLPECVFGPIQTQLQHSVHAVHPRRPSTPSTTFNACEVATHQYVLASTPPLPLPPSLDQQPRTHPVNDNPPLQVAANSATRHVGITGVTWPIDNNDSSPAPLRATHTTPCRVPAPALPPLRVTTIDLTTGRSSMCRRRRPLPSQ